MARSTARWIVAFVILLRLLFLNQAIQGDDVYYLKGAAHALIDPLHPTEVSYAFDGRMVSMLGHPHPPFNAWFLGGLLAIFRDVHEAKFHAIYVLFSVLAALSVLSLARRFSPLPGAATMLFLVTPAFVVNGGSLESDLPFVAFWLAAIACFVTAVERCSKRLLAWSAVFQALSALAAMQAIVMLPILWAWLWWKRRDWRIAWAATLAGPAVVLGWQVLERFSTGALPAAVLSGYMQSYGLQALPNKLRNAAALTGHLGWIVFPALAALAFGRKSKALAIGAAVGAVAGAFADPNPLFWASFGVGVLVLLWCAQGIRADGETRFLAGWVLLFFAAALILFFAGSARYLLPLAAPVAILCSRALADRKRWLWAGIGLNLCVSLALALANYQQWGAYRNFADRVMREAGSHRVWSNAEWGFRFYLENDGGAPYLIGQEVRPGDYIVSSELGAYQKTINTGGGRTVDMVHSSIDSVVPLRLIALDSKSAYSTVSLGGLRPFDISLAPIDRVKAEAIVEQKPTVSVLPMNAPQAPQQIVSGFYQLEDNAWRWTSDRAVVLLKGPAAKLHMALYIPDSAPARRITVSADGRQIADETYPGPGSYTLEAPLPPGTGESVTIVIGVDKVFSVPGDTRRLGIIVREVGLE